MNVYVYGKIFSEKSMEMPKCILSVKLNSFPKGTFEDDFPFPKVGEMLVPWRIPRLLPVCFKG